MTVLEVLAWIWLTVVAAFWEAIVWIDIAFTDDAPMVRGHDAAGDAPGDRM